MRALQFAPQAMADIETILRWSFQTFGVAAEVRYNALIRQGLIDLQMDASRAGVTSLEEFGIGVFYYRLQFSRQSVSKSVGRVRSSPHVIVFQILKDQSVMIGRVLHERQKLTSSLRDDFRVD